MESRRAVVERVAGSRYVAKSARLRDLLLYLCGKALEGAAADLHEQEIGHRVFGRPPDYDTAADNIVRVHASMLRKRLAQYFAGEGRDERWTIEIPKGGYVPVFRERAAPRPRRDWRLAALASVALLLAGATVWLWILWRGERARSTPEWRGGPAARAFWSRIFDPARETGIVLDDASIALYQELLNRPIGLSEYYDRSYLRKAGEAAAGGGLDRAAAESIMLRRHSSYAAANLLWRLAALAPAFHSRAATLQFARDYSFRNLRTANTVLFGNTRSNPWIEPFEPRLGLRWTYESGPGVYFPVDTWARPPAPGRYRPAAAPGEPRVGYCMIALLPNLGGTGSVLIISGTGGSAINAGAAFLEDESSLARLLSRLEKPRGGQFPDFEALIKTGGRGALPKDLELVICRAPRG
ncbi:MAG: hypothetical protein ACE15B_10235 [Bryobacteraceae bacterium]